MFISDERLKKYRRLRWCLWIPDKVLETEIVENLRAAGHTPEPVTRYWQDKDREMLNIPWEAAFLVAKEFPNPDYLRVILHSSNRRGWCHWKTESPHPNPLARNSNNDIFQLQNADRIRRSVRRAS